MAIISEKNNILIKQAFKRSLPATFVSMLTLNIHWMIDSMMAGFFFDTNHIAAVGIAYPPLMMIEALTGWLSVGATLKLAIDLGRGDKEAANRSYSMIFLSNIILGFFAMLLFMFFAEPIAKISGATTPEIAKISAAYMRMYSPLLILEMINFTISKVLVAYGYAEDSFKLTMTCMIVNFVASILLVKFSNLGIAALSLGSVIAESFGLIVAIIMKYRRKINLAFKIGMYKFSEMLNLTKLGFADSCDYFVDNFVASIINNILGRLIGNTAIAVYSIVTEIRCVAECSICAVRTTSSPLFGLLYGSRDKNGIKSTFKNSLKLGFVVSLVWNLIMILSMPLLLRFYGVDDSEIDKLSTVGITIVLAFFPVKMLMQLLAVLYEATERFISMIIFSVTADSIIFPLLLLLFVPSIGYLGIWIAYGLSYIIFLLGYYIVIVIEKRTFKPPVDDIMRIADDIRDNVPKMDISITADNANVVGISKRIQEFLENSGVSSRNAYITALCMEELAVDFIEHMRLDENKKKEKAHIMDIKLFVDNKKISTIIKNDSGVYNPLNFDTNAEDFSKIGVKMAQMFADEIEYNYMFRMNVIKINIGA